MFGKSNGDGGGDDRQDGPAMQIPEIPALRTFIVTKTDIDGGMTTVTVQAHEVEINQMGNLLRFRQYMMHPEEGPTNKVVRCIMRPAESWLEYEETIPEKSRIHTDVSGLPINGTPVDVGTYGSRH